MLLTRASLVLLGVLMSPTVVSAATEEGSKDTIWEWFIRLITWAAGGWHGY
jgi:hypothetical protein